MSTFGYIICVIAGVWLLGFGVAHLLPEIKRSQTPATTTTDGFQLTEGEMDIFFEWQIDQGLMHKGFRNEPPSGNTIQVKSVWLSEEQYTQMMRWYLFPIWDKQCEEARRRITL